MVETMSFGTPMGSSLMAAVAMDVPPDPPMENTPSNLPLAYRLGRSFARPLAMVAVAKARSFFSTTTDMSMSTVCAISWLDISGEKVASNTPQWMVSVSTPASWNRSTM